MAKALALAPLAAMLLLPGCRDERAAEPGPEPTSAPSSPAAPPVSIIRPEVVPEAVVAEPLAPLEATIPFAEGGYALSEDAEDALAEVAESKQLAEGWPVVLRGHTDSAGADEANLRASRRRAEVVADWLVDHGVARERIEVISLGEQRPIAPNAHLDGTPDEEGRAQNRRVTVTIAPGNEADTDPENPETPSGS